MAHALKGSPHVQPAHKGYTLNDVAFMYADMRGTLDYIDTLKDDERFDILVSANKHFRTMHTLSMESLMHEYENVLTAAEDTDDIIAKKLGVFLRFAELKYKVFIRFNPF